MSEKSETLFFDESGSTGSNYLDPEQPFFALSSVRTQNEAAEELLSRHFGQIPTTDVKFARLRKSGTGQAALTACLRDLLENPSATKTYLVAKEYAVVAKYVDWLIEPCAWEDGLNLYEGRELRSIASVLFYCGPHMYSRDSWTEMLRLFQNWATSKGDFSFAELRTFVLGQKAKHEFEDLARFVRVPFLRPGERERPPAAHYAMDISFTSAYCLVRAWMEDGLSEIEIVHDNSNVMEAQKELWNELADPIQMRQYTSWLPGDHPPLAVRSVRFSDAGDDPALQLADVLAGANVAAMKSMFGFAPNDAFAKTLKDELDLPIGSVGNLFPTMPEEPGDG